jgi:hypothetical protein
MKKNDIETILPEFAKVVNQEQGETILFHHIAFSSEEYELLGAAIKYATSKGKNVQVICDNYPDKDLMKKLEDSTAQIKKRGSYKEESILATSN